MFYINKYIYGLDLSMSCSGITIYDLITKEFIIIDSISTNQNKEHGERLNQQREFFKDIIKKYPPYEVAIERGFTMHNTSTQVIYRVHGVLNELLHEVNQVYYAPTTVKKAVTGNGRANKEKVKEAIKEKYPKLQFKNDDESDSCAVLLTHLHNINK